MRPRPDAAENSRISSAAARQRPRFNEAAARCRGKREARRACPAHVGRFNEAAARCRGKRLRGRVRVAAMPASMRPRPDAAENVVVRRLVHRRSAGASMRPRPDAAENDGLSWLLVQGALASMRPRPDAAENARRPPAAAPRTTRFNEAAARCRGKLRNGAKKSADTGLASMRPRPDAAENARAAAGRRDAPGASMRPRPDAAENFRWRGVAPAGAGASMRPRPDAAENAFKGGGGLSGGLLQ